jgi:glutaredoxin
LYTDAMNIILYTKTGCPWCKGVLDLFAEKGVKYEEREVTGNKAYFDELVAKSGQNKTPTLDIDGEILADSDAPAVTVYLKEKGYPGF